MSWFIKYRPNSLKDVENQEEAKSQLKEWIESWLKGKPSAKAVLLYGRPGTGKTTLAYALAKDYGLEILEMNASDSRRIEDVRKIVERGATQGSLFAKGKIILLDEVDGVSGKADYGSIRAVTEAIQVSRSPVILTANNPWDPSMRELRNVVKMIEVKKLGKIAMKRILRRICERERIKCEEDAIDRIVELSEGDARYAINALQSVGEGLGKVTLADLDQVLRRKEAEYDPFETLRKLFWARQGWQAREAVSNSEVDYELLMRWIQENIPEQYSGEDMWRAFDALSRASIFLSRTRRTSWDMLIFMFDLMGPGVAMAERAKFGENWKASWRKYRFPQYVQEMYRTKQNRAIRDSAVGKIAGLSHCSTEKALNDIAPFVRVLTRAKGESIASSLGLTDEEVEFLSRLVQGPIDRGKGGKRREVGEK